MNANYDILIIGAGPYGLSAAAHLKQIGGLKVGIFGEPMGFWRYQVPEGMLLRSPWAASNLSDPAAALTLDAFCQRNRQQINRPIPLDKFLDYTLWFQREAVPNVDPRSVTAIQRESKGFTVTLADGEPIKSRRVVVATGIAPFAQRPSQLAGLSRDLVSHTSDQREIRKFNGKRVIVVGAGQSALESAALIHEAGGDVEVVVRSPRVHWLGWKDKLQRLGSISKVLFSPYDIGPAGVSRIVAVPDLVQYFPRSIQDKFRTRALKPAGSVWLFPRMAGIRISTGRSIVSAAPSGRQLQVSFDDGSSREVDHLLLGTGYRVDIKKYPFLSSDLGNTVSCSNGFPKLSTGFESSIPGLHFLGAPSAWSYGPLMYFVAGTDYAARAMYRFMRKAFHAD
jgi:FAD-dependent urate hydroxylase